jgi:hypothetical protein
MLQKPAGFRESAGQGGNPYVMFRWVVRKPIEFMNEIIYIGFCHGEPAIAYKFRWRANWQLDSFILY